MSTFKNRVAPLALSAVLVLNTLGPLAAMAAQYTDVNGHWAQQAIDDLSRQGVITGYPTGEFRPQGAITRAEFATMLVKAENLGGRYVDNGNNFVDVPSSFWAYRNIETVSDLGLVSGYPGGTFRPTQNITRSESMAILTKAAGVPVPSVAQANRILQGYNDADMVPAWARQSTAAAIESGIFANFPNPRYIQPNVPATRGEVAAMADNLLTYQHGSGGSVANQPNQPTNTGGQTSTGSGTVIHGNVSMVPAQTIFSGVITQALSSDRNRVGDPVTLTLDRPLLSASGDVVIPQGSRAIGSVSTITPAGRLEKNASIGLTFNQVVTPDGRSYPLSAQVDADNGLLKAGTTKGRVGRIAGRTVGGAAIGGAAGAILGAIKGKGKADDYLARGAVLGGTVGAASAIISKGNEVVLEPGDGLQLKLTQPLTVSTP